MAIINGLKIAVCQMKVAVGLPDKNAQKVVVEIHKAKAAGAEVVVFPEMCIPGYIISDVYEQEELW